jgi:Tfp pilus assembly protein PilP
MGSVCKNISGLMMAIAFLWVFVDVSPAEPGREAPAPAYKGLRPHQPPFDPDRIPDPFFSYLVKRSQETAVSEQAEEEKLKKEKLAAAERLKELLIARTELQKLALSQLTLTAIVQADNKAWAMVRDPKGRGFVLKKGTRIGTNGGVVYRIARDDKKVIIKEPYLEDELHIKYKDVEMKLPDQVYE